MDDIVRQAMTKWPDVPHCHGWLALDARGIFRMRDEAAQKNNLLGDPIRHTALLAFIHRNYACDAEGAWYFQNGPQRVYVDLQATPYIAHTDANSGMVLHDGKPLKNITAAYLTEEGQLILQNATHLAMLDDRDIAQCLQQFRIEGKPVEDAQLMQWLEAPDKKLDLLIDDKSIPVTRIERIEQNEQGLELGLRFGFVSRPRLRV